MTKTLVEVNTDTAIDLSEEIKSITSRMNSFLNYLQSTDKRFHVKQLERDRKVIDAQFSNQLSEKREDAKLKYEQPKVEKKDDLNPPQPKQRVVEDDGEGLFESILNRTTQMIPMPTGLPMLPPMLPPMISYEQSAPTEDLELSEVGTVDSSGRPIKFIGPASEAFKEMAQDAAKQGLDIGKGISSSYRSEEDQIRVYKEKYGANWKQYYVGNSNHMSGTAFDINWNTAEGAWIRKNASRYGFKYNTYSGDSTHFDYVGGQVESKKKKPLKTSSLQPPVKPIFVVQEPSTQQAYQTQEVATSSRRKSLNNTGIPLEQILFSIV